MKKSYCDNCGVEIREENYYSNPTVEIAELKASIEKLETENALYQADADRILAMMPELCNTDDNYELHEAVQAKIAGLEAELANYNNQEPYGYMYLESGGYDVNEQPKFSKIHQTNGLPNQLTAVIETLYTNKFED
ncbi:MAG: hypothetical protein WC810_28205 [Janthinobacterium sp.]|jgi:hypothetical protein